MQIFIDTVVVSHGGNRGSCASVNYVARKMGVHNGTWLRSAMEKCGSALVVVPYDFDQYEEVWLSFIILVQQNSGRQLKIFLLRLGLEEDI
jgi:DNA repair protein REV1